MDRHPWLPNLGHVEEMLKNIGVSSIDELFSDIPEEILLKKELNIGFGKPLSEYDIERKVKEISERNLKLKFPPFTGGGVCPHYVPKAVKAIIGRSEFYTSYTPYQPEINQGLLQSLFEYQSLMAEVLEMEVVNSSLYDWGTALAEAGLMAYRLTGKKKILVSDLTNPYHLEVLETWSSGLGLDIIKIPHNTRGEIDLQKVEEFMTSDTAAVYVEQPNFYGILETELESITDLARKKGIITISGIKPIALGIIKPPGEYDFDIAIGDGQELGLPLNFGGPYVGIMATKWDGKLVKQMPGRIVGITEDEKGNKGYTLILQTREQFIRREKATSNITTNEALMAIANAVYLSLLGKEGLKELGNEIYRRGHYMVKKTENLGIAKKEYSGDFFEEFLLTFNKDYMKIHESLLRNGIHGGLPIEQNKALFCVTEMHAREMIDEVISLMGE
ncbi:aminomethyl-transferring glycine dehydrogenase subunit GcvPA [Acidianus sp. RZ1]|uniref:aminomethyl-transferring glycine dehydrogenase subunit GcvPA n=1 Tax=Acidianus sp. RZ1 TaxID=1540082 RepID=UPI0014925DED|nr:aminomethyl-transferring glycine dehydrogenase subunit GcvPA [Acidianus sp. RZ1]NON61369.1 aminomethyl-transferring glycine dehydrogenase subunit GcvPA [Acidianus sp. RZ1]